MSSLSKQWLEAESRVTHLDLRLSTRFLLLPISSLLRLIREIQIHTQVVPNLIDTGTTAANDSPNIITGNLELEDEAVVDSVVLGVGDDLVDLGDGTVNFGGRTADGDLVCCEGLGARSDLG